MKTLEVGKYYKVHDMNWFVKNCKINFDYYQINGLVGYRDKELSMIAGKYVLIKERHEKLFIYDSSGIVYEIEFPKFNKKWKMPIEMFEVYK